MKQKIEAPVPYWCLLDAKRAPMSAKLTEDTLRLLMLPADAAHKIRGELTQASRAAKIFDTRLYSGVEIDDYAWLFVVLQSNNPGNSVMFAYTISLLSWLLEGNKITINDLMMSLNVFALGVPDMESEDVHKIWSAQKLRTMPAGKLCSDNWLDYSDFWQLNRDYFWGKGLDIIPAPEVI